MATQNINLNVNDDNDRENWEVFADALAVFMERWAVHNVTVTVHDGPRDLPALSDLREDDRSGTFLGRYVEKDGKTYVELGDSRTREPIGWSVFPGEVVSLLADSPSPLRKVEIQH